MKITPKEVELLVTGLELLYVVGKVTGATRENGDRALVLSEKLRKDGKMIPSRFHEERDSLDTKVKKALGSVWSSGKIYKRSHDD